MHIVTEEQFITHCCEMMTSNVNYRCDNHPDPFDCADNIISYTEAFQEYGIIIHDGGTSVIEITFCPWCGTRLPESRRDEILEILDSLEEKLGDGGMHLLGWLYLPRAKTLDLIQYCKEQDLVIYGVKFFRPDDEMLFGQEVYRVKFAPEAEETDVAASAAELARQIVEQNWPSDTTTVGFDIRRS